MNELGKGAYIIQDGYRATVKGNKVFVVKEKEKPLRCKDCAYYTKGYAVRSGYWTTVCSKRPKPNELDYELHYHANPYDVICDLFKQKK